MSELQLDVFKSGLKIILRAEGLSFWVSTTSPKGFSQYTLSVWGVNNEKSEYWLSFPPWNIFIYLKFVLLIWILVTQFSYTPGCFCRGLMGKPLLMSELTQHCDMSKQAQQAHLNQMAAHLKLFSPQFRQMQVNREYQILSFIWCKPERHTSGTGNLWSALVLVCRGWAAASVELAPAWNCAKCHRCPREPRFGTLEGCAGALVPDGAYV